MVKKTTLLDVFLSIFFSIFTNTNIYKLLTTISLKHLDCYCMLFRLLSPKEPSGLIFADLPITHLFGVINQVVN
jgi:hypothetical protein